MCKEKRIQYSTAGMLFAFALLYSFLIYKLSIKMGLALLTDPLVPDYYLFFVSGSQLVNAASIIMYSISKRALYSVYLLLVSISISIFAFYFAATSFWGEEFGGAPDRNLMLFALFLTQTVWSLCLASLTYHNSIKIRSRA
jgi:hypothetical protein